jgi:choline-sulfatase
MNNPVINATGPRRLGEGMDRRGFLKIAGGAAALTAAYGFVNVPPSRAQGVGAQRNLILILTDQDRAVQWFPPGWAAANLPALTALRSTGVSFERAFTNATMCTPARTTLFTGLFPAQHGSLDTLTEDFQQSLSEHQLDPTLPNLATVLKAAGYEVVYKGKWHMSKGVEGCDGTFISDDLARYGFDGWDPPDAGEDVKVEHYGGGTAQNDQRFVDDAVAYLQQKIADPGGAPFCLVLSLVNPHDVLGYPGNQGNGGYTPDYLLGNIDLPPTVAENLITNLKPTSQEQILIKLLGLGPLFTEQQQRNYVNFYGNLLKYVDARIGQVLDVLDSEAGQTLRDNSWIIRTADHGEMGLCHGGLRQKSFVCYEEAVRVPLIWSNPVVFPTGRVCPHLVSHVDLLPTLCSILGVPGWDAYGFSGIDYGSLVLDPVAGAVQDYILFTSDDIYAGQNAAGNPDGITTPPNRIQMIREAEFKYARFYDGDGVQPDQQEFYDLRPASLGGTDVDPATGDSVEMVNLSVWAEAIRTFTGQPTVATPQQAAKRQQMANALPGIVQARLAPRPPGAATPPQNFQTKTVNWTDETTGQPQSAVQITWVSRSTTQYQLQQSSDKKAWKNVGDVVVGNNGPMLLCQPVSSKTLYYRLAWNAAGSAPPVPEPFIEIRGPRRRKIKGSHFALQGRTNEAGNRIEYKVGGQGGRKRSKTASKNNWSISIKGLPRGESTVYVRVRNRSGAVTDWERIVVERVE